MASDLSAQLRAALSGRYQVEREIGRGGMATVYLAKDLRHDRSVALKLLNPELGAVLGVERFLSEIRVTANLQHPNLLPLFDSGEVDGQLFYVMPFVEGESLRHRIEREKQLPVEDAVRIALGIASALDYAHSHDVIHRDLKPENILLQHGEPVIADFGIALAVSRAGGSRVTQTGLSLGTPQYMSPEQATGDRTIDGRSDVYSLGAVLYEMLGGEPPHTGSSAQAIIAKLMTDAPYPLTSLRRAVPPHIAATVHKALEKLPADRWRGAREFADALRGGRTAELTAPSIAVRTASSRAVYALGAVAAIAAAVAVAEGVALARRPAAPESPTLRFQFTTADSERFVPTTPAIPFSISPDDRKVAYIGASPQGRRIYVRGLDDMQTRALPNTDGSPLQPTFSPDGQWIAFVIDDRLVKTPTAGGALTTVLPLRGGGNAGMSWAHADTIIASIGGRLVAVPANGGEPAPLSKPDTARGELLQWGPRVVNDRFVAYIAVGYAGMSANRIGVLDRRTGRTIVTAVSGTTVIGALDDHVLWVTPGGSIMEALLAADGTLGAPRLLLDDVLVRPGGAAKATFSARGTLLYHRGLSLSRLVETDARGNPTPLAAEPRAYGHPRWSPDGRRIAASVTRTGGSEIWIIDPRDGTSQRITPPGELADQPEWSADGRRITYRHRSPSGTTIRWVPADGSSPPAVIVDSMLDPYSARLSPDGEWLVFVAVNSASNTGDLAYRKVSGADPAQFIQATPGHEYNPTVSPDGRHLLFSGTQGGRGAVYVRPFRGAGAPVVISPSIGHEPLWSGDGRTIYYRSLRTVMAARVNPGPAVSVAGVTPLFAGDFLMDQGYANFDVSPDGRRFLFLQNVDRQAETLLIYNWGSELRKDWR